MPWSGGNHRMQLISPFCLGVLGVVSLVVGLRLLLLASRTRQLRRRIALGLADPVVANRIALAFFPPRAYIRRIENRAAQQES